MSQVYFAVRPSLEPLAGGAVPRSAPTHANLFDRRSAAPAGLALSAVDLELLLHRAGRAVGCAVVAQRRALAGDPRLERAADSAVERAELGRLQRSGRPQRLDARPPERLVRVDVPQPGHGALVEDGRLDGGAPVAQALSEEAGREGGSERLRAVLDREIRLELTRLEQQPGSEPAHVAIGDVRRIV